MWRLLLLSLATLQTPPAASLQVAGTAEIRGRVTDAESGLPVARALIILSRRGANEPGRTVATDDEGRYRFAGLPVGSYGGRVDGGRFRGIYTPQALPNGAGLSSIVLKEGETREINVALRRSYAIAVRVVDEWGEPLSGLQVSAKPVTAGAQPQLSFRHETDDRGRLRIFGLEPGHYIVCVPIDSAGSSGPPPRTPRRDSLVTTCYPAASEREAEPVVVGRADTPEIEIRVRRGRTYTVSGRVVDASGAPATGALVRLSTYAPSSSSSRVIHIDEHGVFTISNVQPGDYAIEVTVGGPDRPEHRRPFEAGFLPVSISADADNLLVRMRRGVDVPGRVLLEDVTAVFPTPPGSGLMVSTRLADDRLPGTGSWRSAIVRKDRLFTLEEIFGARYIGVLNVPRGWYVKSIQYDGKDVIDTAVEFKDVKNPPTLDVLLSNRGAVLSGRIVDGLGSPVPRAMVIAFPGDGSRAEVASPMTVTASSTGTFRLGPMRGGEYLLVALPAGTPTVQIGDRDRIARLLTAAERVTLGELEERTVELRVIPER